MTGAGTSRSLYNQTQFGGTSQMVGDRTMISLRISYVSAEARGLNSHVILAWSLELQRQITTRLLHCINHWDPTMHIHH